MNETQAKLDKKVGTKERQILKPAKVKVVGVRLDPKTTKKNKETEIAVLICKHPEREEPIEIGKVKLVKGNTVKVSGLWYDEDDDGFIQKGSAIAELLSFYSVENLKALEGKEIDTAKESDSSNYLVIKCY
ncbi:hypothetical protein GF386_05390 [Candidatus Pacearchaeota archaeon]|nr:hypothetical protein [Candidatus Pacearchaeota archaeon]MBD3283523.1 hypothetical protein [Candidatus Pacearchaeota archaeon]